jgi:hypothetical protein
MWSSLFLDHQHGVLELETYCSLPPHNKTESSLENVSRMVPWSHQATSSNFTSSRPSIVVSQYSSTKRTCRGGTLTGLLPPPLEAPDGRNKPQTPLPKRFLNNSIKKHLEPDSEIKSLLIFIFVHLSCTAGEQ